MAFSLRENVQLTTASESYSWVNPLQLWAVGSADLGTRKISSDGGAADESTCRRGSVLCRDI